MVRALPQAPPPPEYKPPESTFMEAVTRKYKYVKPNEGELGFGYDAELKNAEHTAKKQELHLLRRVMVHNENIVSAGADGEIGAVVAAIEELDLEGNPLEGWAPIVSIASQLKELHWLGLNRLTSLPRAPSLPEGFAAALGGLRTLCLSYTGLTWEQLLTIAAATPALEELHFNGNFVHDSLGAPSGGELPLQKLQLLCVEDSELSSWDAVKPLATLPALQSLNLNGNEIAAVPRADGFAALKVLMLRANPITEWSSIDALNTYPSLCEARTSELPLLKDLSAAAARRMVIARVGGLTILNGGEVKSRSRDDAERFYLRAVVPELPDEGKLPPPLLEALEALGEPTPDTALAAERAAKLPVPEAEAWQAFEAAHPRWRLLLVKHGEQRGMGAAGGGNGNGALAAELIELTIRSIAGDTAHLPPCSRRLPNGLPLKSVKMIACQLFKLEPTKQQLLYTPPGGEKDIPEPLDDDTKSLADLGVETGGCIVIDEVLD